MPIRVNPQISMPVYRQIVDCVKHGVATGELAQGERLPTVRQLAQELQIDRNTVIRAYRVLHREGVISLQHGRGTFVRSHAMHPDLTEMRAQRLELLVDEGIMRALSLGYLPDDIEIAFVERLNRWRRARATAERSANGKNRRTKKARV